MGNIVDIFLPLSLAFIMFSLGLSLSSKDFAKIIKQPSDFFIGAISQIIFLPIIAFILVNLLPLSPELAVGVMIIAAAPGGATSNILTSFARGDVALSISLTAVISLLCVISIPFVIINAVNFLNIEILNENFNLFNIGARMFLIVTVPVLIGMFFRKFFQSMSLVFEPFSKKISIVLFVIVLLGAVLSQKDNIVTYFAQAGLVTLLLNLIMMTFAFYLAKFFASGIKQKTAITIECGLQNGTLAIVVASTIFDGGAYLIPAATYSLIMFFTSLIFVYISRKNKSLF